MKKLLILLPLLLLTGCLPLHNAVDTALKQDEGWNLSGYIIKRKNLEIKIGSISTELLYDAANSEIEKEDRIRAEEAIKDEGFILGIRLIKTF